MTNRLSWLEVWLKGERFFTITNHSRRSEKTIKETVHCFLESNPLPQPTPNQTCYLVIDATWFGRKNCLIIYWDTALEKAQWWRYSQNKETAAEITADLEALKGKGVTVVGATSDGAPGVKIALDNVFPGIPHQRCLVHLQRLSLVFLTRRPRTQAGWELRNLIMQINRVTTHDERYIWRKDFFHWCNKYYSFLKERSFYPDKKH